MVEVYLLAVIGFHVLPFAVGGHQKHVQQRGATVQIELPARQAVERKVGRRILHVACGGDAQQDVLQAYLAIQHLQQGGDAAIQADIHVLRLHSLRLRGVAVIAACVVSEGQQVGHIVPPKRALVQQGFRQAVHLVVDERRACQLAVFMAPFVGRFVFERLPDFARQARVAFGRKERRPYNVLDMGVRRLAAIDLIHPCGKIRIVGSAAPFAGLLVQPKGAIARMACPDDGSFAERSDGIHQAAVGGSNPQFIGQGGNQQLGRRGALVGVIAHEGGVVHAIHRAQRLRIQPIFANNAVHGGRAARIEGGQSRGTVGSSERHIDLGKDFTFAHQPPETAFAIQGGEVFQMIRAELVDGQRHHQLGDDGQGLGLHAAKGQHQYGGNQSFFHLLFIFESMRLLALLAHKHNAKGTTADGNSCGRTPQSAINKVKTTRLAIR